MRLQTQRGTALHCYLQDVQQHTLLSPEEECSLFEAIRLGNEKAKERMLLANLRLVLRVSSHFQMARVNVEDLIAEGNIGLMHAIEKFDHRLGFRFSTYAVHWISDAMRRFILDHGRTIRLPVYQGKRLLQLARLNQHYHNRFGKPASVHYLAQAAQQPSHQVRELLPWMQAESCIDHCADDDLATRDNGCPEQCIERDDLCQRVAALRERLSWRERYVLRLRFPDGDAPVRTYEAIAADLRVTRERARQIQHEATAKLKRWLAQEGIEDHGEWA